MLLPSLSLSLSLSHSLSHARFYFGGSLFFLVLPTVYFTPIYSDLLLSCHFLVPFFPSVCPLSIAIIGIIITILILNSRLGHSRFLTREKYIIYSHSPPVSSARI